MTLNDWTLVSLIINTVCWGICITLHVRESLKKD